MTLEESKIEIQDIIDIYEKEDMYPLLNDRQISALKVAISALQAQANESKTRNFLFTESGNESKERDLILRQAAIDALERKLAEPYHTGEDWYVGINCAEAEIYGLPSAQPEIVMCGQCKYAEVADAQDNQDGYTCQFHRGSIWFSGSYCSWGERRTDGRD